MTTPAKRSKRPQPALHRPVDPDDSDATRSWRSIVWVNVLIRRIAEPYLADRGFSTAQWGILRTLWRFEVRGEGEPRMSELGEQLLVQPPSLSATVDRMVRAGLVSRRGDAADQRTRRIGLTDVGRQRLEEAVGEHKAWVESLMSALTPTEQRRLDTILNRLGTHLGKVLEDPEVCAVPRARRSGRSRGGKGKAG